MTPWWCHINTMGCQVTFSHDCGVAALAPYRVSEALGNLEE
jgi:hypothetical protein